MVGVGKKRKKWEMGKREERNSSSAISEANWCCNGQKKCGKAAIYLTK